MGINYQGRLTHLSLVAMLSYILKLKIYNQQAYLENYSREDLHNPRKGEKFHLEG